MNDSRSRFRCSARSSDWPWLASKISTLTRSTWSKASHSPLERSERRSALSRSARNSLKSTTAFNRFQRIARVPSSPPQRRKIHRPRVLHPRREPDGSRSRTNQNRRGPGDFRFFAWRRAARDDRLAEDRSIEFAPVAIVRTCRNAHCCHLHSRQAGWRSSSTIVEGRSSLISFSMNPRR
jgi:hypothetical protein